MSFPAGRAYVHMQAWQVKRFVASELVPALERHRRRFGAYPRYVSSNVSSRAQSRDLPPAARSGDPLICGQVWTYASQAGRWSASYDPCYY